MIRKRKAARGGRARAVWLAAALVLAPQVAHAQATREGNEYDYRDHQPTGAVQSQERAAGVAPDAAQIQIENHDLKAIDNHLMQRAQRDVQVMPASPNNVYGVRPGGVVPITPNAAGGGSGGASK